MITIKNLRREVPTQPWDVKVARSTVLGNDFIMSGEFERNKVCDQYEKWFLEESHKPDIQAELNRLKEILKVYGKLNLFCWCAPKRCHAETIKRYLEDWLSTQLEVKLLRKQVGITERGDAGLDFSWEKKLQYYPFSILITKNLNDSFISKVKDLTNVIIHVTITGYGGTVVEPNVPSKQWSMTQLRKLIEEGFPIEKVVVRIDPMFPTQKGEVVAVSVLTECALLGIKRVRYSYVDLYDHVMKRFIQAGIRLPEFNNQNFMQHIIPQYPDIRFESCAEGLETDVGCISQYDFELFNCVQDSISSNPQNRKHCKCLSCKVELLSNKQQCPHKCMYCYWKD